MESEDVELDGSECSSCQVVLGSVRLMHWSGGGVYGLASVLYMHAISRSISIRYRTGSWRLNKDSSYYENCFRKPDFGLLDDTMKFQMN